MDQFNIRTRDDAGWDCVSLGEVMLRFDPEDDRIHTARGFRVYEGGGEYNVARNLASVFGCRTAVVTALADNRVGRLVENMIRAGGVDASEILWREADGTGSNTRNGIYFYERGFGQRQPAGCSDRGNTAVSQMRAGEVDWRRVFGERGSRWFHTGGIFAGLSETTPSAAAEAMRAARDAGSVVSYDMNYRESLWAARGGRPAADSVNRDLIPLADVVFGIDGFDARLERFDEAAFRRAAEDMSARFPDLKLIATTLRRVHSASRHDLSAACFAGGEVFKAPDLSGLSVLDRVGSGDAFAAGVIFGLLNGHEIENALTRGLALAALTMASAGDGSTATISEVEDAMAAEQSRIRR
jgi:2-dehydro-3-deoxygluconokinase